ncbi:hypothetical protein [Alteraurantiacibacter aquimixticola]|uniref:TIGR02301 family protein n=1 Tax=Alteraurantiacibacter aquimixticola TaxID=2489173 RepID=A0A4T3F0B3_9SPHN|nr:hypothetical protein [Alteraurantiacibacter aquimixticola]TIX50469.1 hypothetical protein E5222_09350 [Alteraurantiacibacter aquimixticola]
MKTVLIGSTAILAAAIALPAQGQDSVLSDSRVELYAEMLAMSTACREVSGISIREDDLFSWMTAELAQGPEADLDRVLALRDSKLDDMQARTAQVNAIPRGNRRADAVNDHYAQALSRCLRMSEHSVAGEYFRRR